MRGGLSTVKAWLGFDKKRVFIGFLIAPFVSSLTWTLLSHAVAADGLPDISGLLALSFFVSFFVYPIALLILFLVLPTFWRHRIARPSAYLAVGLIAGAIVGLRENAGLWEALLAGAVGSWVFWLLAIRQRRPAESGVSR